MRIFDKLFGKKDKDKRGEKDKDAEGVNNLSDAFLEALSNSQWRETIKYGKELAQIFNDRGNRNAELECYINLGIAYRNLCDSNKAIEYYAKSLEIAKETSYKAGESACYTNLGNIYDSLGDFKKAIECHKKSLEIEKEIGDRAGESGCYQGLGAAYYRIGDFKKAMGFYEKSLGIFKEIGDRKEECKCYTSLGATYDSLGDFKKAIELHKKSLEIAKDIGDKEVESACYTNLGVDYDIFGDFKKAIELHKKSLEIAKDIGDRAGESGCYGNLGAAYQILGDFKKAIEYQDKNLKIAKEIGYKVGESKCYINLGNAYDSLGDFKKAIGYYEKSLEINKDIGDKAGESTCYVNLGNAYDSLGDSNKALEYYEKSLEINKDIGDKEVESGCYINLGIAYRNLCDSNKALEYYEKSLGIFKEIGDKAGESVCYENLGSIYYYDKQDYQKSLESAKNSIKLTEQVRGSLIEEELGLTFLRTKIGVYDLAIKSAINLYKGANDKGYLKDALETIERTKSRELMKIIKAKKKDPKAEKEYKELKEVEVRIAELEAKIKKSLEGNFPFEREVQEKNKLYERKSELYKKIRKKSLDPSSIVAGLDEDITKEFWEVFGKYDDNCTVLQIYELEERIIYVAFDKENFEFFEKRITEEKREKVLIALKNMRFPFISEDTFYKVLKGVINDILPKSLKERLSNIKTKELFIIPHSWLHQIPWEAVVVDKIPLCVKYNLIRHYSLDLLSSSLKYEEKKNKNALLVSNPKPSKEGDLEETEKECDTINQILTESLYNVSHLNREKARIENVENQLSDISIVHFSCHGLFDTEDPFESSILLAFDRKLSANKISLKNLDYYPLVFLNACETGVTKPYESTAGVGDEQIGLVRAFAMAHSPSIIVTGWEIDVDVAEYFAKEFYSAISKNNLIDALKFARENTYNKYMNKNRDWAAYILYGNP